MTEEEEFQYVVSREDYNDFKTSQAKCKELTELLAQSEVSNSLSKDKYLSKIQRLEDELKSYRSSIRQYVDKQIKEVDNLLKILHDYKSSHIKSTIDQKTLNKIKNECDKISQTFNVSLKNLEILNSQVLSVTKCLVEDSLALQQKLKEYSQLYENALQQKQDLYTKIRQQNEKSMLLDKEKSLIIKNEQKLKYQNELYKLNLKQKQNQTTQLQIYFQNTKNKLNTEIKLLKEQLTLNDKKWKEKFEITEKKLQSENLILKNEKLQATRTLIEEIQKLKSKSRALAEQYILIQTQINDLKVAYKQQSEQLDLAREKEIQNDQLFTQKSERLAYEHQQKITCYERQMNKITLAYQQKLMDQERALQQLQKVIEESKDNRLVLQQQLKEFRELQNQLRAENYQLKESFAAEKEKLTEKLDLMDERLKNSQQILSQTHQDRESIQQELRQYIEKYHLKSQMVEELKDKMNSYRLKLIQTENELNLKTQELKNSQTEINAIQKKAFQQVEQLRNTLAISSTEKAFLEDNAKSLTEQFLILKKTSQQEKNKLQFANEQLSTQINTIASSLDKKMIELQETQKAYSEAKSAKIYAQNQFYSLKDIYQKEKKKNHDLKNQVSILNNETNMLRQAFEDSQLSNESLLKEIENLRDQARSSQQIAEASNLLKMNADTLQTEVQRLHKENNQIKKEREASAHELSQTKEELKYMNDDLNSMRLYIEELEQNLEKLSEEKAALKNELVLFKEQAEFCKHESIEQLGIIDKLERDLQTAKQIVLSKSRKQLNLAMESTDPSSIVRRSSLSKGEKSYYVKEMILEYSKEMKKNLDEIGALSHEEVKDLIFSELRELGHYLKKVEKEFE